MALVLIDLTNVVEMGFQAVNCTCIVEEKRHFVWSKCLLQACHWVKGQKSLPKMLCPKLCWSTARPAPCTAFNTSLSADRTCWRQGFSGSLLSSAELQSASIGQWRSVRSNKTQCWWAVQYNPLNGSPDNGSIRLIDQDFASLILQCSLSKSLLDNGSICISVQFLLD